MQFTYDNKIIEKDLHFFNEQATFELPKRLGEKNYAIPFNLLKNLDLVRTFAINRYKLISDYINLFEQE